MRGGRDLFYYSFKKLGRKLSKDMKQKNITKCDKKKFNFQKLFPDFFTHSCKRVYVLGRVSILIKKKKETKK